MILVSHPTGNQNVRNVVLALRRTNLLSEFWTCFQWDADRLTNRLFPEQVRKEFSKRSFSRELKPFIRTRSLREVGRQVSERLGCKLMTRKETGLFSVDAIYRDLDRSVAKRLRKIKNILSGVYAYEDGALETFQMSQKLGLHRFYELPIGYWRAGQLMVREEIEREPEWTSTLQGASDSDAKLARKDSELQLASTIIVPSSFVKSTLDLYSDSEKSVHVVPYGAPPVSPRPQSPIVSSTLRVLFVGALGQRKGLSDLLKAISIVKTGVDLTLIGRKTSESCVPLNQATQKYRWIPSLSHAEVLREMSQHDVLVFPSLFEGLALVILEAMSQGLPVITTPNSGGVDIITDGIDGFIIPIRSPSTIAEKLELLAGDVGLLNEMKAAARLTAEHHSWANYRMRLASLVRKTLEFKEHEA